MTRFRTAAVWIVLALHAGVWAWRFALFSHERMRDMVKHARLYGHMDDWQKRERIMHGLATVLQRCLDVLPPTGRVFLEGADDMQYYYATYYLYPRDVIIGPPRVITGREIQKERFHPTEEWLRDNDISMVLRVMPDNSGGELTPVGEARR